MYLIYQGPHLDVEVPVSAYESIFAEQGGPAVDFPDDIAEGLLEQGTDSAEENPQHQPQWVKATAKQISTAKTAADKAAAAENAEADTTADAAKDDNSE